MNDTTDDDASGEVTENHDHSSGQTAPSDDEPIPGTSPTWAEDGQETVPPSELSIEEPDPPWILDFLGEVGIYMGVAAVGLTVVGLGSALIDLQPIANIALVLALGLVSVALVFGAAYQAYVSDLLP